ncbi:hypothetical protein O5O45_08535 [Hahella aquimaris]|uniref:hypothetical protein n=1 Tax=Hahella sp. HNIBRBA332 TaxID=3015983 RepID=UPI00273C51E2|nr:hypothetical protein [Hahella sp. HNIBRBA332]WLQ15959.1 hypothetical protein O5O45_08535 [Hahella sp. HNIBRBA332]
MFTDDEGSLPDIWIENITQDELVKIYGWVMSLTKPAKDAMLWSLEEDRDMLISDIADPAVYYIQGKAESFRHLLDVFTMNGVTIPQLSMCLGDSGVEFDYRMGKEWGPKEVYALFEFLYEIKKIAPAAKVTQSYEGGYYSPNSEFALAFEEFCKLAVSHRGDNG